MTEKEKMQKQMLYDANYDKDLLKERNAAKDLCYEYNQLRPSDEIHQQDIIISLLGKTKGAFTIDAPFRRDYGYNIEIGENFFANHNTVIPGGGSVVVKDIPGNLVAVGNPCKVIREITQADKHKCRDR